VSSETYPFAALVGQDEMRLALLLVAVNPALGGLLIRGEKGTAKSTAARGLAALLPPRPDGRPAPFVDLPLGATEDRVIGAIDLEATLRDGRPSFQPGLLARADGGVLYVDEVNLLDDPLVEAILEAAGSGLNRIEREGRSLCHSACFVLIGTMNPEEGEVRPQLLDRFGLAVQVGGDPDPARRVALLRARESFEADPAGFVAGWAVAQADLARRLAAARARLVHVLLPPAASGFIAEICRRNRVAGHRADLAIDRAARALAAWEGRDSVSLDDIVRVAPFALLHRMRGASPDLPPPPPEPPPPDQGEGDDPDPSSADPGDGRDGGEADPPDQPAAAEEGAETDGPDRGAGADSVIAPEAPFRLRRLDPEPRDTLRRLGSGRRGRTLSANRQGREIGSTPRRGLGDIAFAATLRAAAPHQLARRAAGGPGLAVRIRPEDLREKRRERRVGSVLLFLVDGSGSMGAQRRMGETKAAILSLLLDAYQKRDRVALLVFRGRTAETVLPPTGSVERAARLLTELPVGGRTPLSAGLVELARQLGQILRRDPAARPLVFLLTDGRANAGLGTTEPPHEEALRLAARVADRFPTARFLVIDTEAPGLVRLDLAPRLARALGGLCLATRDLRADLLVSLAKEFRS